MPVLPIAKNLEEHSLISHIYAMKLSQASKEEAPKKPEIQKIEKPPERKDHLALSQRSDKPSLLQDLSFKEEESAPTSNELGQLLDLTF